jgi:hypothetical protein
MGIAANIELQNVVRLIHDDCVRTCRSHHFAKQHQMCHAFAAVGFTPAFILHARHHGNKFRSAGSVQSKFSFPGIRRAIKQDRSALPCFQQTHCHLVDSISGRLRAGSFMCGS